LLIGLTILLIEHSLVKGCVDSPTDDLANGDNHVGYNPDQHQHSTISSRQISNQHSTFSSRQISNQQSTFSNAL
jgi:hypothetical protein